jgi:hypothetical protein
MSDTILGGKLTVYYEDENRRKQIRWTGLDDKTDTQKMIDVYDATEDLMTQPTQSDDGLIFSAETPSEYTVGKIDAGEIEPWFIDLKSMQHIIGDYQNFTGCALKTDGWARVQDSNAGIVVVAVVGSSNTIVEGDIGQDITHGDGDAGTLLDVIITGGATDYLWIRPDSDAVGNNWDSGSGTITEQGSSHTAEQEAAAVTGEMVWGNVYTQGALVSDTHVYMLQDGVKITAVDKTNQDWWVDGHVDRAVPIKDYTTAAFPTIDEGYLTVKANQYTSKHSYAVIRMNTTTGGQVSAGLSSGYDSPANTTGYASITLTGATGNWNVGDEIQEEDSSGGTDVRAILTQIDNPGATPTLHFYYIGDPLISFTTSGTITNQDDTGTGTENGSGVANQGPALATWFDNNLAPTYAFANAQADIDDDGTNEEYGITITMNSCLLAEMHEYNKYAQRRGSTVDHDGIDGEQWIGIDYAVNYSTITGTVSEGATVTGATSGATGIVVSNPGGSSNTALLRNSRGTFVDGEDIEVDSSNHFDASGLTVDVIVPVAESSFGTLAGTSFFASRGVLLSGYKSTEENNFSLIDATGTPRARPTTISFTVSNTKQYDQVAAWRMTGTGGTVDKTEFTCDGGEVVGDATLNLYQGSSGSTIPADVVGKTTGSSVMLVDVTDNNKEYLLRFSSYNATTGQFTLANTASTSNGGSTSETVIHDTGATFTTTAKVGDLLYNTQGGGAGRGYSYVKSVDSDTQLTLQSAISGQVQNDSYELNCVPITVSGSDQAFVAIAWEFRETDGTVSTSMQYVGDFYVKLIVRNTSDATTKIKGYTVEVPVTTLGGTATVTRIPNVVYGS